VKISTNSQAALLKTNPSERGRGEGLKFPALGTRAPARENPTLICVELTVTANSDVTVLPPLPRDCFRDGWLTDDNDKLFRRGCFARMILHYDLSAL